MAWRSVIPQRQFFVLSGADFIDFKIISFAGSVDIKMGEKLFIQGTFCLDCSSLIKFS